MYLGGVEIAILVHIKLSLLASEYIYISSNDSGAVQFSGGRRLGGSHVRSVKELPPIRVDIPFPQLRDLGREGHAGVHLSS